MLSFYLSLLETPEDRYLFACMYEEYHYNLEHYALSILRNQYDAEDATHNAFTYVAHRFERYRRVPRERRFYWVKRLVFWNSCSIRRKQKRLILVDNWAQWDRTTEDPTNYYDLFQLFREMPLNYQEPLELRVVYGYSCAEIAKRLRITTGTVYIRLNRGRRRMRRMAKSAGIRL